jgi:hypothetical protein
MEIVQVMEMAATDKGVEVVPDQQDLEGVTHGITQGKGVTPLLKVHIPLMEEEDMEGVMRQAGVLPGAEEDPMGQAEALDHQVQQEMNILSAPSTLERSIIAGSNRVLIMLPRLCNGTVTSTYQVI